MSNLFINDVFHTIQGEGRHAGRRALFVRMPYCNLNCSWCDTEFNSYKKWSYEELIAFTQKETTRFAVVTGGEPMMNRHTPMVVETLKSQGFEIAVETNGSFAPNATFDWVTCSPKRDNDYYVHPQLMPYVNEYKYVVDDGFDFSVLDWHGEDSMRVLSLSPEHGNFGPSVRAIVDYIAANPRWRLSLQTHKMIGVP